MQDTTDNIQKQATDKIARKRAPILCATVIIGVLAVFLVTFIYPLLGDSYGEVVACGILIIYGSAILAVIAGILLALRQRLKEIEGGEEDEARKY